jgi:signal transduction histidine kinase
MARIVAQGTGAAEVQIWLKVGSHLVREASWPEDAAEPAFVPVVTGEEIEAPGADALVPVRHDGELLGAISVSKGPGERTRPSEQSLLENLAAQAGLVLRNVRLIEDLRTSRQRLVTAEDEERRRLERDLHDGAQQRLVSIALALRMARGMVTEEENPKLAERIDAASEQLTLALSELRELARGIHPAILTERGLTPALVVLAERSPVPVTVESFVDRRLSPGAEAAAYFVVSEGLTNVAKYAQASSVTVRAAVLDGVLSVEVVDDGIGGADPSRGSGLSGLADRVAAIDGTLEIDSPPGMGTRLACLIPVPPSTPAPVDGVGTPAILERAPQPEAVR